MNTPTPPQAPRSESSGTLLVNLACLIPKPTGISTYALNLLPHIQTLNPTLLVSAPIAPYRCHPIANNQTSAVGIQGRLRRLGWTQWQLPSLYRSLQAALLFSPLPEAPIFSSCRYIVTVHDLIPLRFPKPFAPRTLYFHHWVPYVLRQAQHIVCNSLVTAQDVHRFFHIPLTKLTVIPLACDTHHFQPAAEIIPSNSLSYPSARPYFLYIGHHEPYKNLHRLIAAFAAIPQYQEYELRLVGSSDRHYTPSLRRHIAEKGLGNQVKLLDYVAYQDLPGLLHQAIALVFPSLWEGFGIPVLEAMACGTPVITSNLAALPEVAGDAAILVDPYNVAAITDAMTTIATDLQLQQHLRQQGLARTQQFSWEKTGTATAALLQSFL